jgi:DnaK suppressor protein
MTNPQIHLSEEQLAVLRSELERALAKLERSMKTTRKAARPVKLDQTSVGRLSRMDALQNQSLTQGLQEREQVKAALLREALERLERGAYGVCTGCGEPIQFERLELFPEALTCSRCAG